MKYSFKKIYGDMVTQDGTVIIIYLTWFNLFGFERRLAGVEIYRPNGKRELFRAMHFYNDHEILKQEKTILLQFQIPHGTITVQYNGTPAFDSIELTPVTGLFWKCLGMYAECFVQLKRNDKVEEFAGTGYRDWVSLDRFARYLGLSELQWGRVHLPDRTLMFNSIGFNRSTPLKYIYLKEPDSQIKKSDDVVLQWNNAENYLNITSRELLVDPIQLHTVRVLHQGDAIDSMRFPGILERALVSYISGRISETRWLGRCSPNRESDTPSWALHERVFFG